MASCQLTFELERQRALNWCWAAVAVSVARYFDSAASQTQCRLASECLELAEATCCLSGEVPDLCDQQFFMHRALERVGRWRKPVVRTPLSFAELCAEIDGGNPVVCWIKWQDNTGHFIVVSGYDSDQGGWITVQDPSAEPDRPDAELCPYDQLRDAYRTTGRWRKTYLVG